MQKLHKHGRPIEEIAERLARDRNVVRTRMKRAGLIAATRARFTEDELETIRINYADFPTFLIAYLLGRPETAIYNQAARLGLKKSEAYLAGPWTHRLRRGDEVGKQHQFKKGQVPHNKGLRRPGWAAGRMRETQFKKGEMSGAAQHNYVPIGTLRIKDGVLARKLTDDQAIYPARRWVPVHRTVWEAVHGPVPDGHLVRFKRGLKTTEEALITIDRLELVSHAENMRLNTIHRYPEPVRDAMRLVGRVKRAAKKRTRDEDEDRGSAGAPVRRARGPAGPRHEVRSGADESDR